MDGKAMLKKMRMMNPMGGGMGPQGGMPPGMENLTTIQRFQMGLHHMVQVSVQGISIKYWPVANQNILLYWKYCNWV